MGLYDDDKSAVTSGDVLDVLYWQTKFQYDKLEHALKTKQPEAQFRMLVAGVVNGCNDVLKEYPYQFVCYRITDFRSDAHAAELMIGRDLVHDLGLFIREVARSMPAMPIEDVNEPVLTLEEFSRKLNVTTKTINRWRKRGLIGCPVPTSFE